jgi:hypothetical protein
MRWIEPDFLSRRKFPAGPIQAAPGGDAALIEQLRAGYAQLGVRKIASELEASEASVEAQAMPRALNRPDNDNKKGMEFDQRS